MVEVNLVGNRFLAAADSVPSVLPKDHPSANSSVACFSFGDRCWLVLSPGVGNWFVGCLNWNWNCRGKLQATVSQVSVLGRMKYLDRHTSVATIDDNFGACYERSRIRGQ